MPYGHIKQYLDMVEEAQRKRLKITSTQERQIARMFGEISEDLSRQLKQWDKNMLPYRWIEEYIKSLQAKSEELFGRIQDTITANMTEIAESTTYVQLSFWGNIEPVLSQRFKDTLSNVPKEIVDELMNGGFYKDFTGLSERLWDYRKKFDTDIGYMINRGILAQKSAYDMAKDLEIYLKPNSKKEFDWRKVYPKCNKKVDYSAQRLARTSATHAYQLSFQRTTLNNPFITKYQWLSSNAGRSCELCLSRNGKLFDKDMVPLDHPNGMCVIVAVIDKNYDQIAEELADWANGGDNPALDKWLQPRFGADLRNMKISISEDVYRKSGITREVKDRINRTIDRLQEEYVIKLSSIETGPMGKGDMFGSGPYMDESGRLVYGLVINADMDYTKIMERAQIKYEKGIFAGKSIEDYITHEMAHIMVYQGCETVEEYEHLKKIVSKLYVPGISGYADKTKSGDESLAEAFVRFKNGERIPARAKVLITAYIERWRK